MKSTLNIYKTALSILLFTSVCSAQDIHLSQYDANPLYVNPAFTGFQLDNKQLLRCNINYRNQNLNVLGSSNKTSVLGLDMRLGNKFSIGQMLINNSINNSFNSFNFLLSGSYKIINKDPDGNDRHNLLVGLQMGFIQKSFSLNSFTYDSQYSASNASGFDSNLPTGETFGKQNDTHFDMNMGVFYKFIDENKKYSPFGGFSIYHLTQPNQALSGNVFSQTPMRFTLHGGCSYTFNKELSILPQFIFMDQGKAKELNVGVMAYYKIKDTSNYEPMIGIAWRAGNAIILQFGLKYKSSSVFRISYDINTYYLKQYGNRGVELSLVHTIKKKKQHDKKSDKSNSLEPVDLEKPKHPIKFN